MADVPDFLIDAVKNIEGFQPTATWDYKQASYGYGRKAPYVGATTTPEESHTQLVSDLGRAASYVDSVNPNIPPGPRAALISLTDNAGPGWSQSGLGDLVRSGDWQGAAERLQQYNKAGGHELPGLTARRQQEASWFNGIPSGNAPSPIPSVSAGMTTAAPATSQGLLTGAPLGTPDTSQGDNDALLAQLSRIYQSPQFQPQQVQPLQNFLQPNSNLARLRAAIATRRS